MMHAKKSLMSLPNLFSKVAIIMIVAAFTMAGCSSDSSASNGKDDVMKVLKLMLASDYDGAKKAIINQNLADKQAKEKCKDSLAAYKNDCIKKVHESIERDADRIYSEKISYFNKTGIIEYLESKPFSIEVVKGKKFKGINHYVKITYPNKEEAPVWGGEKKTKIKEIVYKMTYVNNVPLKVFFGGFGNGGDSVYDLVTW